MDKPLVVALSCFIAGLLAGSRFQFNPLSATIPILGAAAILLLPRRWFRAPGRILGSRWLPLLYLLFFTTGWARFDAARRLPPDHVFFLDPVEPVELTGTVDGEPVFYRHSAEFILRCREAREGKRTVKTQGRVLVMFHGAVDDVREVVQPGRSLQVQGGLDYLEERGNPGEVSQKERLGGQEIYRLIRVYKTEGIVAVGHDSLPFWKRWPLKLKRGLRSGFGKAYSPDSLPTLHTVFLQAIVIGDRTELPAPIRQVFREASLAHLLAISGLHVGFIWLLGDLLLGSVPLRLRHVMIMVLVGIYVIITGANPPAVRAGLIAAVFSLSYIIDQPRKLWTALAFAALLILAFRPFSIFRIDFQLSFLIVAAIMSLAPIFNRVLSFLPVRLRSWLAVPLAAQLGAMPLTAHYFSRFYPSALIANLVVVPLAGVIVNLGFVSSLLGVAWGPLGAVVGYPNRFLINAVIHLSDILAHLPLLPSSVCYLSAGWVAACFGMIFWLEVGARRLKLGLLLVVPVILTAAALVPALLTSPDPPLKVIFFNGCSGDFTLIEAPGGKIILACPDSDDFEEIPSLVTPYFAQRGIRTIDYLVLTRVSLNHLDSLSRLREYFQVKEILDHPGAESSVTYRLFRQRVEEEGIAYRQVAAGDKLEINGGKIDFLWPPREIDPWEKPPSSLVFRLELGEVSVLWAEKLGTGAQRRIMARAGSLAATILKAPMKGSRAHNLPEFLAAVRPAAAVLAQGREYFGRHPAHCGPELEKLGAKVYLSSRDGALILESDGANWKIMSGVEIKRARWRFAG